MLYLIKFKIFLSVFCIVALAAPYQKLPAKPGYIPVYIREGNTPLSQVNPKLVEAFHEDDDVIPNETETAFDIEIVVNNGKKQATEKRVKNYMNETNEDEKTVNGNEVENKGQEKSRKESEKQEPKSSIYDIADYLPDN